MTSIIILNNKEERNSVQHTKVDVVEDVFEDNSDIYEENHIEDGFEETDSANFAPSSNRYTSGKVKYISQKDNEAPDSDLNEENSLEKKYD